MIGTTGATVLFIVNFVLAGILGIAAGGLTGLIQRRPWGLKAVGIDAVLAIVVAIIAVYVLTAIEVSRGIWGSIVAPVWAIAVLSVVGRHLLAKPG